MVAGLKSGRRSEKTASIEGGLTVKMGSGD